MTRQFFNQNLDENLRTVWCSFMYVNCPYISDQSGTWWKRAWWACEHKLYLHISNSPGVNKNKKQQPSKAGSNISDENTPTPPPGVSTIPQPHPHQTKKQQYDDAKTCIKTNKKYKSESDSTRSRARPHPQHKTWYTFSPGIYIMLARDKKIKAVLGEVGGGLWAPYGCPCVFNPLLNNTTTQ